MPSRPPIEYLIHNRQRLEDFAVNGARFNIIVDGVPTVSEGYDVSVLNRPPGAPISKDARSILLTYKKTTLRPKRDFNRTMEAETQSWAEYAPQAEFDFTAPVVYSRAPSSLSYGLDPSLRIERSELVHRQVDASSVVYEDENFDPSSEEPIKYLVLTGDITATFEFLHIIKGRLRRDSTLCFLQPGVGFFERINKEIFPDPRTRPGYMRGIWSHLCWSHNRKSGTEVIAERTALEPADKKDNIGNFSVNHKSGGSLFLGPIVECPDEKHQYAFRKRNARYLREILFGAGALDARGKAASETLRYVLTKTAIDSVVQPMTVVYRCKIGEIISTPERLAHARALLRQSVSVIQHDCPQLTYKNMENVLGQIIQKKSDLITKMSNDVECGRRTDIDSYNGWIATRYRELYDGKRSDIHEDIIRHVNEAVLKKSEEIEEKRWIEQKQRLRDRKMQLQDDTYYESEGRKRRWESVEEQQIREDAAALRRQRNKGKPQPIPNYQTPRSNMRLGSSFLSLKRDGNPEDPAVAVRMAEQAALMRKVRGNPTDSVKKALAEREATRQGAGATAAGYELPDDMADRMLYDEVDKEYHDEIAGEETAPDDFPKRWAIDLCNFFRTERALNLHVVFIQAKAI